MKSALIAIVMLAFVTVACESPADVANPKTFENESARFSYPGNWTVTEEPDESDEGIQLRVVTLETPGDAIVVMTMVQPAAALVLEDYAKLADELRAEEIKQTLGKANALVRISTTKVLEAKAPAKAQPGSIRHDFAISVFGEEVPHWGDFHLFRGEGHDVITYAQAAHEDWSKVEPGFELIYRTLEAR